VNGFVKTLVYIAIMVAMYCSDYNVPVGLYWKRTVFVTEWKMAAFLQRRALGAYRSYVEEVEASHG
jgi:hypothetical protein